MAKFLMIIGAGIGALALQGFGALGVPGPAITPASPPEITINRVAKADRLPQAGDYVKRVRTSVIPVPAKTATAPDAIAYRPLEECEPLVNPLADRMVARRARVCAA